MSILEQVKNSKCRISRNEKNDCSVVALTLATNVNYDVAHKALEKNGRQSRKGAYVYQIIAAVKDLGCQIQRVELKRKYTSRTIPSLCHSGTYLVNINQHIYTLKDGVVLDYTAGRRHIVESVYRVYSNHDIKNQHIDVMSDSDLENIEKRKFISLCRKYNVPSNWYKQNVRLQGVDYQIVALKEKKQKYPVIIRRTNNQNECVKISIKYAIELINKYTTTNSNSIHPKHKEYRNNLETVGLLFGLTPSDFGQKFEVNSKEYSLLGCVGNNKAKKPIIGLDASGNPYAFTLMELHKGFKH